MDIARLDPDRGLPAPVPQLTPSPQAPGGRNPGAPSASTVVHPIKRPQDADSSRITIRDPETTVAR